MKNRIWMSAGLGHSAMAVLGACSLIVDASVPGDVGGTAGKGGAINSAGQGGSGARGGGPNHQSGAGGDGGTLETGGSAGADLGGGGGAAGEAGTPASGGISTAGNTAAGGAAVGGTPQGGTSSAGGKPPSTGGTTNKGGGGAGGSSGANHECSKPCEALQACSAGQCVNVLSKASLRLESTCAGPGSTEYLCQAACPLPGSQSLQVAGASSVSYDVVVEISGLVELTAIPDGTLDADHFWLERTAAFDSGSFDSWGLKVAGAYYYLNAVAKEDDAHTPLIIEPYRKTLRVAGGTRLELFLSSSDCEQLTTCDPSCRSVQIDGRDIDTQFVEIRFVSVTPVVS
ncbi:MAG TPA: hypothetical protein VFQ61_03330 [Polyangiaceae bacterium]|nr:hypothetical protein [Polyangiaceae bacterium]